jgi:hypothetical protein
MPIWVFAHNHGYEGHEPPFQAFSSKEEAIRARAMIAGAGFTSIEIYEVPLWPEAPNGEPKRVVE